MTYSEWITTHVEGSGYGLCAEVTAAMVEAFPELRRVRGHYLCAVWGRRAHWWLVATDGSIIDPTASQFPTAFGEYVEHADGDDEPSGKCMNCGGYVYGASYTCSPECAAAVAAYYGASRLAR